MKFSQAQTKIHPSVFSSQVNKGKEAGKKKKRKRKLTKTSDVSFFRFPRLLDFCRLEVLTTETTIIRINSKLTLVPVSKQIILEGTKNCLGVESW